MHCSTSMNRIAATISDVAIAIVCAVIAVISIIPFSVIALVSFGVTAFMRTRSRIRSGQGRFAATNLIVASSVFAGLVAGAAAHRPSKIVEQLLCRSMTLPSTRMTLAELSYTASFERDVFPIQTSFRFADDEKDKVIDWPRRDLTLGELLDAIESQTVLRRRFSHCGNGYTVLGGGDCAFGLYVRDPELAISTSPRDQFDVYAYAADREHRRIEQ